MTLDRHRASGSLGESREGWSFTKSRLYLDCPRAFHLAREANRSGINESGGAIPRHVINLSSLVGIAVHQSIADQIDRWVGGFQMSLREAQSHASAWLTSVLGDSEHLVTEKANGLHINSGILSKLTSSAKSRLHTFFLAAWPQFRGHEYVLHETLRSFCIQANRVWVKVDLCTKNPDGEFVITDWKTGRPSILQEDMLQMSTYVLWAAAEFSIRASDVHVRLANLRTGEMATHKVLTSHLAEATDRISRECRMWSNWDSGGFLPLPEVQKCYSCRSLRMCNEGQEVTSASAGRPA